MYKPARRWMEIIFFLFSRKTNKVLTPRECTSLDESEIVRRTARRVLVFCFSSQENKLPPAGFCFLFSFGGKQNVKTLLDRQ
jgi:hypothetical protein